MGAWIEIVKAVRNSSERRVAPLVGAWIEIVCGTISRGGTQVAPLVGAWIEIPIAMRRGHSA